jgi:hypothetical protein
MCATRAQLGPPVYANADLAVCPAAAALAVLVIHWVTVASFGSPPRRLPLDPCVETPVKTVLSGNG